MLVLLSPAKTLDYDKPPVIEKATQPRLLDQSEFLVDDLKDFTTKELGKLMDISSQLAGLNRKRYANWETPFTKDNAKQAALAFKGDVYVGMDAESFSEEDFDFAQDHVRILSGLYGVLRPLDLMQPYRLEMGTSLETDRGKNLYEFWGDRITNLLNEDLESADGNTVVNLASNEYFKSVNTDKLNGKLVTPAFRDLRGGTYKIISFYAKKMRGVMTAWIVKNRITDPDQLAEFEAEGYTYAPDLSSDTEPTFTRDEKP